MTAKEYREHLYTQRTHPHSAGALSDGKESLSGLYASLLPCLLGEYWLELKIDSLPSGILFPTAYLLFWAFYYTYYRPGSLESKLTAPNKWDILGLPTVLVGICVWFVKVAVVEFVENLLTAVIPKRAPKAAPKRPQAARPQTSQVPDPNALPRELENALAIMGLQGCRDWRVIQKRYRELAKKYHPDLNPEITTAGNRFMIYDGAYKRLMAGKDRYFT